MNNPNPPDIFRTLGELDAGSLQSQATYAMRDIAQALRDLEASKVKGRLIIDLTLEHAKGSGQLLVTHKLTFTKPTETGKASEETNGDTLLYVGRDGSLTVLPETQTTFQFTKTAGEAA